MLWSLCLLFLTTQAQYAPLPDCQAISPSGHFFDWTELAKPQLTSKWFLASICGLAVTPCSNNQCAFCETNTNKYCDGYTKAGVSSGNQQPRWSAYNSTVGLVTTYNQRSEAHIIMKCDPTQNTPIISGGNAQYPRELTYVSKHVCPIGICPEGCHYNEGWGVCHPTQGFKCTCNIGFKGATCSTPDIAHHLTSVSGPYASGFVAGGSTWIGFEFFNTAGHKIPCTAVLPITFVNYTGTVECRENIRTYHISGRQSGVFKFGGYLFGQQLKASPYTYIVSPGLPVWQNSAASGTGLYQAKVGLNTSFIIQLRDNYKNEVTVCPYLITDHFLGSLFGVAPVPVTFTCSQGKLIGEYVVPDSGDYQLLVRYENDIVPGFPTSVKATQGRR